MQPSNYPFIFFMLAYVSFFSSMQAQGNLLEGKFSIEEVDFRVGRMGLGHTPLLEIDEKGQLWCLWRGEEPQWTLSMFEKGQKVKSFELKNRKYWDIAICADGIALLSSKSKYATRWDVPRKLRDIYFPKLLVEYYSFAGDLLWEKQILNDIVIKKENDQGFYGMNEDCATLEYGEGDLIIYCSTMQKFDDGNIHQGDIIMRLNEQGTALDVMKKWYVSHSFGQKLDFDGRHFHLLALGDAYPRGINHAILDKEGLFIDGSDHHNIFEFKGRFGDNAIGDTHFATNCLADDSITYVLFHSEEGISADRTEIKRGEFKNDVFILGVNKEHKVVFKQNLSKTIMHEEADPEMAFYGDHILVAWRNDVNMYMDMAHKGLRKYVLITKQGTLLGRAADFDPDFIEKLGGLETDINIENPVIVSNFVTASDGSVYFLRASPLQRADVLEIVKIMP